MVARTKISPSLLVDESDSRRSGLVASKPLRLLSDSSTRSEGEIFVDESDSRRSGLVASKPPSNLQRKDSFSETSLLSHSESFDDSCWSSSPSRAVAPAPSAARVRSRFLNRLGITPPPSMAGSPTPSKQRSRLLSRESVQDESFQVSLKDGEEAKASVTFSFFRQSSPISTSCATGTERAVSFAPSVTVHPIPRHTAYSSRIRETIWTNPTEMQESAARNCIEFAAENWNWRQVAEDQDMVYYHGELIHPVHFAHEYNIRRQFCAVMSAQQGHALR